MEGKTLNIQIMTERLYDNYQKILINLIFYYQIMGGIEK